MIKKIVRAIAIAAFISLAVCQTGPALAFGLHEELGRHSMNAMAYFHLPLGSPRTEERGKMSFGIKVQGQLQIPHQAYDRARGPYVTTTTFDLMDVRFGRNGRVSGFEVGGLNVFGTKPHSDTGTDPSGLTER